MRNGCFIKIRIAEKNSHVTNAMNQKFPFKFYKIGGLKIKCCCTDERTRLIHFEQPHARMPKIQIYLRIAI